MCNFLAPFSKILTSERVAWSDSVPNTEMSNETLLAESEMNVDYQKHFSHSVIYHHSIVQFTDFIIQNPTVQLIL